MAPEGRDPVTHFQEQCEHGTVYAQCRCPSPEKTIRRVPCGKGRHHYELNLAEMRGVSTPIIGPSVVKLANLGVLGGAVRASIFQAAQEHFTDMAKLEALNLKIRMICPADLLPAVDEAVALRVALIKRHNPEVVTTMAVLLAATEAVYLDLATGWLPKANP